MSRTVAAAHNPQAKRGGRLAGTLCADASAMLRFGALPEHDEKVHVIEHNLDDPLPDLGRFDAIVSSFAIHHCTDARKRALYGEIHAALSAGGVFLNLEHVAPATPELHARFLRSLGITPADEDPSNKLVSVETQVRWLREIGFQDVDCHWRWLELALFGGIKKAS
jgi:tRNA (cmo5U34)-methyltransferase